MLASKKKLKKNVKGLSLIELLVAMVIGMFILSGLATAFISSKHNNINRNEQSKLEDNGKFALEIISKYVQHTGYSSGKKFLQPYFITGSTDTTPQTCPKNGSAENNILSGSSIPASANGTTSDTLGIMYHGDANNIFTDCMDNALPEDCRLDNAIASTRASLIYNSFFVDTSTNTLRCSGSRSNNSQIISEGIENIQFLYGVKAVGNSNVGKIVNASQITADEWNNVISVYVALLVRSDKPMKSQDEAITYTLLDKKITYTDRYERKVFQTTIPVRNNL